jgi:hypothetical protein
MMNALVLAIGVLVSSTAAAPAVGSSRAAVAPSVFAFDLPDITAPSRDAFRRPLAPASRQSSAANRHSRTDRIIAVVAGVCVGFVVGGTIGAYAAENRDNPDDDVSLLRGVMIGAPIGAALGGVGGYWLTK